MEVLLRCTKTAENTNLDSGPNWPKPFEEVIAHVRFGSEPVIPPRSAQCLLRAISSHSAMPSEISYALSEQSWQLSLDLDCFLLGARVILSAMSPTSCLLPA
jgi:hypothetical protein